MTIGQLDPAPGRVTCLTNNDFIQTSVSSGEAYVVPGTGTITSWSHNAIGGAGQDLTLKFFRKVADPATYMVVSHDGPRPVTPLALNTFPASIPVKPGDILGVNSGSVPGMGITGCLFPVPFNPFPPPDSYAIRGNSNLADGEAGNFNFFVGRRINVSAVFVPSNSSTLGAITRNKKKGTATLTVNVPNPGELTGSGNGVKASSAGRAVISKSVVAGQAQLLIKAKGKKKKQLNQKGKVKLSVAVTYTPTAGDPSTRSVKVKLMKKLKKKL